VLVALLTSASLACLASLASCGGETLEPSTDGGVITPTADVTIPDSAFPTDDACLTGQAQQACGFGGQACADCFALGDVCFPSMNDAGGARRVRIARPGLRRMHRLERVVRGADRQRRRRVRRQRRDVQPRHVRRLLRGERGPVRRLRPGVSLHQHHLCVTCATGQSCIGGTCIALTQCGSTLCAGCCDTNDVCHTGTADTACGTGGLSCQDCANTAQTCKAGACQ